MPLIRVVLIAMILASTAQAAVVFETNFDSVPTWNPTAYDACFQNTGIEGAPNDCTVGPWTGDWVDGNTIWNDYRVLTPNCGSIFAPHIGSAADITAIKAGANFTPYGGTGKSYVHFYEPCMSGSGGWGSDGLLSVYFGKTGGYSELYVQMMVKFQPGFIWSNGNEQKFMHITHFNEHVDSGVLQAFQFFSSGDGNCPNGPDFCSTFYKYNASYPNPQPKMDSVRSDCSYVITDPVYPSVNVMDGNWHSIKYYLKLNTAANQSNGIERTYIDGVLVTEQTNIPWTKSNTPTAADYGFNRIIIGGNTDNVAWGTTGQSQWFAVDNLVVSTTDIATDYVPGGGEVTPVASVTGCTIVGTIR